MPWLLARSILTDLLRTGAVITLVLVTVIAFGATLKPLAREELLTIGQAVRYVILAMVPMLQFAIPFAAGFAGTLNMHRMAVENELVAAAATGISYSRLLAPIAGLGLALLMAMLVLTQEVIPRFLARLAEVLQRDVALLFQASVGKGDALRVGDLQIWADDLVSAPADEGTRLILFRVAVANIDAAGRVEADLTAERITVNVTQDEEGTLLDLDLADAVVYKPSDGMLAWIERPDSTSIRIPSVSDAHVRSMTGRQLRVLRERPETYPSVRGAYRSLVESVDEHVRTLRLDAHLRDHGALMLHGPDGSAQTLHIHASGFAGGVFESGEEGLVMVVERVEGVAVRRYRASAPRLRPFSDAGLRTVTAGLTMGHGQAGPAGRFELVLEDCQWVDESIPDVINRRAMIRLENVSLPEAFADAAPPESLGALAARIAETGPQPSRQLTDLQRNLDAQILRLERRIDARQARRYAVSATAPLLLLAGSVLAMLLRRRSPLAIYSIAFVPAIFSLILISSGEQILRDGRLFTGFAVMWSGNIGTAIVGAVAFWRLRRN